MKEHKRRKIGNMGKFVILSCLFLLCGTTLRAQQDLLLSQQFFSRINVNPAGTGNNENLDLFFLGRFQWMGVKNSPKTLLLNFSGYSERFKSSLGLTFNYDNVGVAHSTTNAQLVYSYHLDITEKYILSLGLSGGINVGHFDPMDNIIRDEKEYNSDSYVKEKVNEVTPDLNFGAEFTSMHWMVGASCTHLLNDSSTTFKSGRHFYFYGRGFIPLSDRFDIAPALVYMHKYKTNVLEVNAMLFYERFIWAGVTWCPNLANPTEMSMLAITAGFELKNRFRFGYTYDLNLGKYNNLPSNTHEIMFSVQF